MKIAVNAQPMLYSGRSGIGYYQSEIVKNLTADNKDDEFCLQYFDIGGSKTAMAESYRADNVKLSRARFSNFIYQMIWAFVPLPYTFFFKEKPDVSVFFNFHIPPFARGKKVLLVHDTVVNDYPETMRFRTKMMLRLTLGRSIKRADRIVTISQFSKGQIMKHYGVPEEKITVIPCAADRSRFFPMKDREGAAKKAEKYGVKGDYFLYLGNLEPRKNIVRLINGYALAKKENADMPKLALAGGKGWLYEDIFNRVRELSLEDDVIFTGYLEEDDVPFVMNGARAFCFPSLYEGFGMPPLEAMCCGVPVMVADCTSLPEVVGSCGIKVDPYSEEDIAAALIKLCGREYAEEEGKKCLERCDMFSWKDSAAQMRRVIGELADE